MYFTKVNTVTIRIVSYESKIRILFDFIWGGEIKYLVSDSIIIISTISISVFLLITIVFAVTVYSVPDSTTVKEVSLSCHDKILDYARIGFYLDVATVKVALASCDKSLHDWYAWDYSCPVTKTYCFSFTAGWVWTANFILEFTTRVQVGCNLVSLVNIVIL